jgi:disulfide bond formation protein DsbB
MFYEHLLTPRLIVIAVLAGAAITLGGALIFEHGFGYLPCALCLQQRVPYYVALIIASVALVLNRAPFMRMALLALAVIFIVSFGMGAYHAGIEWRFWAGPADCATSGGGTVFTTTDLLKSLQTSKVVSCTDAAWRFLKLSLAGWNALISLCFAGLAAYGLFKSRAYGSSSVSQ